MTPLSREVSRVCPATYVRFRGRLRKLVVTLLPGDVLELRPAGCRQRYLIPLGHCYSIAVKMAAAALVAERKAKRKRKP